MMRRNAARSRQRGEPTHWAGGMFGGAWTLPGTRLRMGGIRNAIGELTVQGQVTAYGQPLLSTIGVSLNGLRPTLMASVGLIEVRVLASR